MSDRPADDEERPAGDPAPERPSGELFHLATEGGVEHWLDLATGRQRKVRRPAAPTPADTPVSVPGVPEPALLPLVLEALEEREWRYDVREEGALVTFGVLGENAAYECAAIVDDDVRLVTMLARTALRVPDGRRVAACELLMRANWGLAYGAFEMDFTDGEVRYRVTVDVEGGAFGARMAHTMIAVALEAYDRWYGALMRVVYADVPPEVAARELFESEADGDGGIGEEGGE